MKLNFILQTDTLWLRNANHNTVVVQATFVAPRRRSMVWDRLLWSRCGFVVPLPEDVKLCASAQEQAFGISSKTKT